MDYSASVLTIILVGVFVLFLFSGMLGLGAAFATIPFLSIFMADVVHEVQPTALLLNGFTAAFGALGFSRSGLVRWRDALLLAITTTASAPCRLYTSPVHTLNICLDSLLRSNSLLSLQVVQTR